MFMSSKSAVALSSLLLLVGFQDGRTDSPAPKPGRGAPTAAPPAAAAPEDLRRPVQLQISVFEVEFGEPGKFIESANRLRGIETDAEFEKALDEFGTPHRFTNIDRMADLSEELSLVLGSSLPVALGKSPALNNAMSVQYRDVGSSLTIRRCTFSPDENCLYAYVDLDLSTVLNSKIELSEGVFSPIYTKWKTKSMMRLEFGKPDMTIDFVSHSKDEDARAVVIRSVVTDLK